MIRMFERNPSKNAAWFICKFFVGPKLAISTLNTYGNYLSYEWKRAWRWRPGAAYVNHDPPVVSYDGEDISFANPFTHKETFDAGLVFSHYAYVISQQVEFKTTRYEIATGVYSWKMLQCETNFPQKLSKYLPWVKDEAMVDVAPSEHWFR